MTDITSLEARKKSILRFKKAVQKKGRGEVGFKGLDTKKDFNELVKWENN